MIKTAPEDDKAWHLDKRVNVALILAICIQTAGAIWWASNLSSRVSALEKGDEGRIAQTNQASQQLTSIAVDIAVLKENVKTTKEDVTSMKNGFDAVIQQVLDSKTKR